jgi:hypothetical protein
MRSVGARGAHPGWSWSTAPWLGGDLRGLLVARDRRHLDVQQGGAGHPVRARAQPEQVGGATGEAGLGPRVRDRCGWPSDRGVRSVLRPAAGPLGDSRAPRSAAKGPLEPHTGSCVRTSSRAACSRTIWTFRTASTRGPRRPTIGFTAQSAPSQRNGSRRKNQDAIAARPLAGCRPSPRCPGSGAAAGPG